MAEDVVLLMSDALPGCGAAGGNWPETSLYRNRFTPRSTTGPRVLLGGFLAIACRILMAPAGPAQAHFLLWLWRGLTDSPDVGDSGDVGADMAIGVEDGSKLVGTAFPGLAARADTSERPCSGGCGGCRLSIGIATGLPAGCSGGAGC